MKLTHRYLYPAPFVFWGYSLGALLFIFEGFFISSVSVNEHEFGQLFIGLLIICFGFLGLFQAHLYSDISSDEEGLLVRFFFWHLRVRWNDILEVKPVKVSFPVNPLKYFSNYSYLVKTTALTPFHRLYGLLDRSFQPSFVFHSNVSKFKELLSDLERNKSSQASEKLAV